MVGESDAAALRAYVSRLTERSVTDDDPVALRSVQRAAFTSWARKNGIAIRSAILGSRSPFTLRALLGGNDEPVQRRAAVSTTDAGPRSPGAAVLSVGIDIEEVDSLPRPDDHRAHPFFQDHFSDVEIAHCIRQDDVAASFCGTWAAKEAILKSGVPVERLLDIAITHDAAGRPCYPGCHLSISYTRHAAVAVCLRLADRPASRDHPGAAASTAM